MLTVERGRHDHPDLNRAEFVDMLLRSDNFRGWPEKTRLGDLVRAIAKQCGLEERELSLYSTEEWEVIATRLANQVSEAESSPAEGSEAWPHWPAGWKQSWRDAARREDVSAGMVEGDRSGETD